tara:strand:- start:4 stop:351 length:348 start_codon:yes stop_codon:yes gene_type:complete
MEILELIAVVLVCLMVGAQITLWEDIKYYKRKYKQLDYMTFNPIKVSVGEYHITGHIEGKESLLWFYPNNDFKIGSNNYLHNAAFTYFAPYSCYWYFKYKRKLVPYIKALDIKEY